MLKNSLYYETESYSEDKRRNSSTVIYIKNNKDVVGLINLFIQIKNENEVDKIYALIERCDSLKAFKCSFIKQKIGSILLCKKKLNLPMDVIEDKNINIVLILYWKILCS